MTMVHDKVIAAHDYSAAIKTHRYCRRPSLRGAELLADTGSNRGSTDIKALVSAH